MGEHGLIGGHTHAEHRRWAFGTDKIQPDCEAVLRQCTNPTMTAKLQDIVRDLREMFRGDSERPKGPDTFNLLKSEFEVLETQLRDEEATQPQPWKAVRFNFATETGDGNPSMAAAAQSSEKWPLQPCFFAAARYVLKMKLVDDAE